MKNLRISILRVVSILVFVLSFTACNSNPNTPTSSSITSASITSGVVVNGARPASTGTYDSPVVKTMTWVGEVIRGELLSVEICFDDSDGNVRGIIIAEKGKNKYNVIPINAGGIFDGDISLGASFSFGPGTGSIIEFDVGLVDGYDNVSNYRPISVQLMEKIVTL